MDGDVTITGDLTVSGGISLSLNEVLQGTSTIDITDTEALLVRKDGDGGDVFVVDTTNSRVGIGESSPDQLLHLKATSGSQVLLQRTSADTSSILGAINFGASDGDEYLATIISQHDGATDSAYLAFQTEATGGAKTERMRITSAGKVGIGTNSPSKGLSIESANSGEGITMKSTATEGDVQMNFFADNGDHFWTMGVDGTVDKFVIDNSSLNGTHFVILDSGNTGIGHSAPATTMHVVTTDGITVSDTATDNTNPTTADGTTDKHLTIQRSAIRSHAPTNANSNLNIGMKGGNDIGAGAIIFQTGNTEDERMRIEKSGTIEHIGALTQRLYVKHMHSDGTTLSGWVGTGSALGSAGNTDLMLRANNSIYFTVNNSGTSANTRLILDDNSRISLSNNDGGSDNTVFGGLAGNALTTNGDENVLIGHEAGNDMTTGERNVVIGYQAGDRMTISTRSVAIGYGALGTEDVGDRSIAIGFNALHSQNSDSNNETTGNVGIGVEAGFYNQTGQYNTLIGTGAGLGASGQSNNNNTAVGYSALNVVTTGSHNVVIGKNSGDAVTDGSYNVFMGYFAGSTTTSAERTIAIGSEALETGNHTHTGTIAIGSKSLQRLVSGSGNTSVGYLSSTNLVEGNYNTVLGEKAFDAGQEDSQCVAIGYEALTNADVSDTGSAVSTHNTAVGYASGDVVTTGTKNTLIGSATDPSSNAGTNQTVIGFSATGVADNSVTLGDADVTAVYMAEDSGATIYASNGVFIDDTPFITVRDSSSYSAGTGGGIALQGLDSDENLKQFSSIQGYSIGSNNGGLAIYTRDAGSNNLAVIVDNNRAVKPGADSAYDLGTSSLTWRNIFVENIKFPGTQVASADANTLDDYEEGTWTPAFPANTLTGTLQGTYTKVGDLVTVFFNGQSLDYDGSGNSNIIITGLPFTTASSDMGVVFTSSVAYWAVNITGTGVIQGYVASNTSQIELFEAVDNGAMTSVKEDQFSTSSGSALRFTLQYKV
jgi:hypothetical protein